MKTPTFSRRIRLPIAAEEAFAWHERPGAFECLTPPWSRVRVIERTGGVRDGDRVVLSVPLVGPFRARWVLEHRDFDPPRGFHDVQVEGPFASWSHAHTFVPEGPDACVLEDRIEFALPLGRFGRLAGSPRVLRELDRLFDYRHRRMAQIARDLRASQGARSLTIAVTGATGLIGSALVPMLTAAGHRVIRLVRSKAAAPQQTVYWNPSRREIDREGLQGIDAVVHLGAESIAAVHWTVEKKRRIRSSRVSGTRLLAQAVAGLDPPPRAVVCASGISIYEDRTDRPCDESGPLSDGFLPTVVKEWEAACDPARRAGIRVVNLRLAPVLNPAGGVLHSMLPAFRLGIAGRIGHGRQYFPWISIDDAMGALRFALRTNSLEGPVNVVAPDEVTNAEFTRTLGRVLRRPTLLPTPVPVVHALLGEMGDELLLRSIRAEPRKLIDAGYGFELPELEPALRHLLGRVRPTARTHD